uniref:Si:ch73-244f7.3 n=1 Tax=Oryzias melastigma TaxID=30732 RepID=A0A3B3DQ74_ORYME
MLQALSLCHYLDTHRDQHNLVDKAVLEIGAGTGLVSVVAALLGAWVTATDLPDVLSNLRVNLSRNTRGRCRHTPQVASLSWGFDLEPTYPSSVYRYDYVLAADVVYHHDYLDELLATMKHFCKQGTTLIWANKVRFETDLTFTDNFKKAFHTSLLAEDGEMKIFMATSRQEEEDSEAEAEIQNLPLNLEEAKTDEEEESMKELEKSEEAEHNCEILVQTNRETEEQRITSDDEEIEDPSEDNSEEADTTSNNKSNQEVRTEKAVLYKFVPSVIFSHGKDIYHYVGEDIVIYESIDSYGGVMWPAALALCSFLEKNKHTVNLEGKTVLELGAGTGLVSIVATLLGGAVTATDLPQMLSNLRANVMRNTRGRCRHTPQIASLPWGFDLEPTYPSSVYRYDYVLAADVVYHHDCLDELLATMKHFCKQGTTLIWANKVRFETDLTFTDNFKKAFHTSLLAEDGEMKIFMATSRQGKVKEL